MLLGAGGRRILTWLQFLTFKIAYLSTGGRRTAATLLPVTSNPALARPSPQPPLAATNKTSLHWGGITGLTTGAGQDPEKI